MPYVDSRLPHARPWPAGLGQGPIRLEPFPPPPDLENLPPEELERLERAARLGLVAVIVLGVGALLVDAILKRRR